jgi:CDP-paratose 2-epimerase
VRHWVSGICGVVGSCFAREMLARGDTVIGIDACEEPRNRWLGERLIAEYPRAVTIHKERLEKASARTLNEALSCDTILHAAASTGIPHSAEDPDDDWVSNVDATKYLLDALRLAKSDEIRVPPTVVLSSVKPYRIDIGAHETETRYSWTKGVNERAPLEPDEPYAASKMAQSALAQAYARTYDLPIVTFRCSNLYGPAPCHGPRHGWLTWFCISAALGRVLEIQGNGKQTRDMLHTSDVTAAVLRAFAGLPLGEPLSGEVFNLGGGHENAISVQEAAAKLMVVEPKLQLTLAPGRKHEDPVFVTDTTKFMRATGWRPKRNVDDGLLDVFGWAVENRAALAALYAGV